MIELPLLWDTVSMNLAQKKRVVLTKKNNILHPYLSITVVWARPGKERMRKGRRQSARGPFPMHFHYYCLVQKAKTRAVPKS